ncbi:MAG: metal-dependent hydrolase [Candidatus Nanoarchaeia archaeon]
MPARKTHLIGALVIGLITGLLLYKEITYALIFTLLSGVTANLPDQIEKPTNSMHRSFFHSIIFFITLVIIMTLIVFNPLSGLVYGYITHLLLDYALGTHKPIICSRF